MRIDSEVNEKSSAATKLDVRYQCDRKGALRTDKNKEQVKDNAMLHGLNAVTRLLSSYQCDCREL